MCFSCTNNIQTFDRKYAYPFAILLLFIELIKHPSKLLTFPRLGFNVFYCICSDLTLLQLYKGEEDMKYIKECIITVFKKKNLNKNI